MRIIAGDLKGRRLAAPEGMATRPTADRARQALFDVLTHRFADRSLEWEAVQVLDGFAGTGAVGIEALSRGAARATFVESDPRALLALRANLADCALSERATVLARPIEQLEPAPAPADLVFLDPPYRSELLGPALIRLAGTGWLTKTSLVVVEIAAKATATLPDGFQVAEARRYGAAQFLFLIGP